MLPSHTFFTHASSTSLTWRSTACHFQLIYDTQHFLEQGVSGPIVIFRLRFRAGDGEISAGGSTYGTVNVQLSSCPLNYAAASTTFATNRGIDNQLCYAGSVTTLPTTGASPNEAFVDLVLSSPFTYDPTLGLDLVVEVDATAPSGPVPLAAAQNSRCRRISAASTAATTGTSNATAGCMRIDFGGAGGWSTWAQAATVENGTGCYEVTTSFLEEFTDLSTFDLSNQTLVLNPNGSGGYDVSLTGATTFAPHGATHLNLDDDDFSVVTLPGGFGTGLPFPTGSTTSTLTIGSNGHIGLGTDVVALFPDREFLLLWPMAQLAPFLVDLVPDTVHNVYYDVAPGGMTVYVTYDALPTFTPGGTCSMQIALFSTGRIEYRYGTCSGVSGDIGFVGFSRGSFASDPGSVDLSVAAPLQTSGPDSLPVTLFSGIPYVGTLLEEEVAFIPPTALFSVRFLASGSVPGIDLGIVGAVGCPLWFDLGTIIDTGISIDNPNALFSILLPNVTSLFGQTVYSQGASFDATANPFGILTTNQSALTMGNS
ncbi:MAG: hypothetical protein JNL08_08830 [Planctomycetes bacterium]|nr:hypothetical protein [Planctomycetota bacterium]